MSALSILLALALLWILLGMGLLMVTISLIRLRTPRVLATAPATGYDRPKKGSVSLTVLMMAIGLFFTFWGAFGTIRLIWLA